MDYNESFSREIEDIRAEILVKDTIMKTLQQEMRIVGERIIDKEDEIKVVRK